ADHVLANATVPVVFLRSLLGGAVMDPERLTELLRQAIEVARRQEAPSPRLERALQGIVHDAAVQMVATDATSPGLVYRAQLQLIMIAVDLARESRVVEFAIEALSASAAELL